MKLTIYSWSHVTKYAYEFAYPAVSTVKNLWKATMIATSLNPRLQISLLFAS